MATQRKNKAAGPETTTTPELMDADRRRDMPEIEELPVDEENGEMVPTGEGFSPSEDGGNPDHPIHDEDLEDKTPADYEKELDRLDAAVDNKIG